MRSLARVLTNADRQVARKDELIAWLQRLQAADGSFGAEAAFERRYHEVHPAEGSERDRKTLVAWSHALGGVAPQTARWAHSALEDAWCVLDALDALDVRPLDVDGAVRWVQSRQCADGAFRAPLTLTVDGDPYLDALFDTLYAVRALGLLAEAPSQRERCVEWLLAAETSSPVPAGATRIDALGELRAIDRLPPNTLDRWDEVSFSENEDLWPTAPFESWAATRAHQWLVGAYG